MITKLHHPLLALIASATNNELAKYVEYVKAEDKILRARIPGQIHTKPEERERLLKLSFSELSDRYQALAGDQHHPRKS